MQTWMLNQAYERQIQKYILKPIESDDCKSNIFVARFLLRLPKQNNDLADLPVESMLATGDLVLGAPEFSSLHRLTPQQQLLNVNSISEELGP